MVDFHLIFPLLLAKAVCYQCSLFEVAQQFSYLKSFTAFQYGPAVVCWSN